MADIQHKPRRLRDLLPEKVFAREWEALASALRHQDDLDAEDNGDGRLKMTEGEVIIAGHNRVMVIGQEEAALAATFITWLGTSIGRCFLDSCRTMQKAFGDTHLTHVDGFAFLAAWALHNARHFHTNNGWRSCEYMAWDGNWNDARRFDPPPMSADQLEILDNMARWLGTREGGKFLERCEALIFAEQKELSVKDLGRLAAVMPGVAHG